MDKENNLIMEDHSLLMVITSLVGALGLKSIWDIIKKKMDIAAAKDERVDGLSLKVIEELKDLFKGDLNRGFSNYCENMFVLEFGDIFNY